MFPDRASQGPGSKPVPQQDHIMALERLRQKRLNLLEGVLHPLAPNIHHIVDPFSNGPRIGTKVSSRIGIPRRAAVIGPIVEPQARSVRLTKV